MAPQRTEAPPSTEEEAVPSDSGSEKVDGAPRRYGTGTLVGVIALGMVVVGVALAIMASALPRPAVQLLGPNLPISAGAGNPRDLSANNSPVLLRNPTRPANVVVANRIDLPRYSCAFHTSLDAGATFTKRELPFPAGEEDPPRCYAPDAVFAANGNLLVSFVTLKGIGNVPNAAWLVSSTDGGSTFSMPTPILGPLAFQVHLAADPTDAKRLYLTWLQAQEVGLFSLGVGDNAIQSATSGDGGKTWSAPVRVSPPGRPRALAPSLSAGPDGRLELAYLDIKDDALDYNGGHEGRGGDPYMGAWSLVLARSTDAGATWSETAVDDRIIPTGRFVAFLPPTPSLLVDRIRGRVHVAFSDGRAGDADVWIWSSTDGGATFGPASRVNDTPLKDATAQYMPSLALAPDGRIDIAYYDRRADRSNLLNEVSLQSSRDGGRTFGSRLRLSSQAFDSRVGFGSERNLADLGSRISLLSSERRALAVWTDTRAGTDVTGKQDLARQVVDFQEGSGLRTPMRIAGWALVGLAVAVGFAALVMRPRRRRDEGEASVEVIDNNTPA